MNKPKEISLSLVPSDSVSSVPSVVSLNDRATRVLTYHTGVIRSFGQQMGYAFLCGLELNAAKTELAYGAFERWREDNLPQLRRSTAHQYRVFADLLQAKSKRLSGLTQNAQNLLTNGELDDSDRAEILQAVHDVTDGKTLTQLYRDLGVIREKQKQKHTPVKLTPEQAEADRKKLAEDFVDHLSGDLRTFTADNKSTHQLHADLSTPKLKDLHDDILTTSRKLRDLLKARKQKLAKTAKKKGRK
jgi:hypothetical protein